MKRHYIWLLALFLIIATSVSATPSFIFPVDIDYTHPEKYLVAGTQSTIDQKYFEELDREISISRHDIEDIGKIYSWMMKTFTVFSGGGQEVGSNTINKLLKRKSASGCHDHGLIFSSVLRYFGYPAIMVDTAGIQWAEQRGSFSGHVFIEIFVNGKWILADSNSGEYIENYDPNDPVIPITKPVENKGFYVLYKGVDPAGYGVKSINILENSMMKFSRNIRKMDIQYPPYIISGFKSKTVVLGSKTVSLIYSKKYAPGSKMMAPIRFQSSDQYDTIILLRTPEMQAPEYITNMFSEMNKTEAKNYVCIKKIENKMLIYFDAENESKLLEMIDKFGNKVNIDIFNIGEERYIAF